MSHKTAAVLFQFGLLCLASCNSALAAETNAAAKVTNLNAWAGIEFSPAWFATNTHWRSVNGTVYNTRFSKDFILVEGGCVATSNGRVVLQGETTEPIFGPGIVEEYAGGNLLGGKVRRLGEVKVGERTNYFYRVVLNFPKEAVVGNHLSAWAKSSVRESYQGKLVDTFDCGTAPTPAEIEALKQKFIRLRGSAAPR